MNIALLQMNLEWEAKEANLIKAARFIVKAKEQGADIAVLPEMFTSGFSVKAQVLAEKEHGWTHDFLSAMARDNDLNLLAGYQVRRAGEKRARNVARAYDRTGRLLATYTKMHPFSYAEEDRNFLPGEGPVVFPLDGVPSSVFICYDLRFPEAFRQVAREAALVFVIANWPSSRSDHWTALLKARAIENQCLMVGVNRSGEDGNGLSYAGRSQVISPLGEELCACGETEEVLVCSTAPLDVERVRAEYPFMKDMRTGG
jgi:predicted amidohydrolase